MKTRSCKCATMRGGDSLQVRHLFFSFFLFSISFWLTPSFAGVQYAFLILLFLFTAIFAWRVRSIPHTDFNESREIFMAVYNVGFVSVIAVPLASVFWYEPNASSAVIAAGSSFASLASVLVMFAAKLARVVRGKDSATVSGSAHSAPRSYGLTTGSLSLSREFTQPISQDSSRL